MTVPGSTDADAALMVTKNIRLVFLFFLFAIVCCWMMLLLLLPTVDGVCRTAVNVNVIIVT
jgi:hypothetical protein